MLNTRAPKFNPPGGRGGLGLGQPMATQPAGPEMGGAAPIGLPSAGMSPPPNPGDSSPGPGIGIPTPAGPGASGMSPQGPMPMPGPGTQMPPANPQAMNALARVMAMRR